MYWQIKKLGRSSEYRIHQSTFPNPAVPGTRPTETWITAEGGQGTAGKYEYQRETKPRMKKNWCEHKFGKEALKSNERTY